LLKSFKGIILLLSNTYQSDEAVVVAVEVAHDVYRVVELKEKSFALGC